MRRLLAVFAGASLILSIAGIPAYAAPAEITSSGTEHQVTKGSVKLQVQEKYRAAIKGLKVSRAKSSPRASLAQDPPGGGCDYSDITGQLNWTYVDGVLATLEGDWLGKILCTTTAPGQSMEGLVSAADLYYDPNPVSQGIEGICTDCNLASSHGNYICAGPQCSGRYWVAHFATMQLPAGWVWIAPIPTDCTLLNASMITCTAVSTVVTVPRNG